MYSRLSTIKDLHLFAGINMIEPNVLCKFMFDLFKITSIPSKQTMMLFIEEVLNSPDYRVLREFPAMCNHYLQIWNRRLCFVLMHLLKYYFRNSFWSEEFSSLSEKLYHMKTSRQNALVLSNFTDQILDTLETIFYVLKDSETVHLNRQFSVQNYASHYDIMLFQKMAESHEDLRKILFKTEYQAFVSILNQDYTKSSIGYSFRREYDNEQAKFVCKVKECEFISDRLSNQHNVSHSDDELLSVSESDEENNNLTNAHMVSNYFSTLNKTCNLDFSNLDNSDSDDDIVFLKDFNKNNDNLCKMHLDYSDNFENSDSDPWDSNDNILESNDVESDDTWNYDASCFQSGLFLSYESNLSFKKIEVSSCFSQQKIYTSSDFFEGLDNPCFEDDSFDINEEYIKNVNDNWNKMMHDVTANPKESSKVSFVDSPQLITYVFYEPESDDEDFSYSSYALDRIRFERRIKDFEMIIKPYLTMEYRAEVIRRNNSLYNSV